MARMPGLQPQLPLVEPDEGADDATPRGAGTEWHLDDHTREVGRRGIAAARAHLHTRPGHTDDRPGRAPGRAA